MRDKISYQILTTCELLLKFYFVRYAFLATCILKHYFYRYIIVNEYKAIKPLLRFLRIVSTINNEKVSPILINMINHYTSNNVNYNVFENMYINSYINSRDAILYRNEFNAYGYEYQLRLKYPKKNDSKQRQGDLLILKPYISEREKGVIFVQYNDSINKFCAIYDIQKIAKYYRFVIEPSTWGYQDLPFFLLLGLNTDVIIEAQYENDFNYINELGNNLYPIRIGAGDWVDPDVFRHEEDIEKRYDIIMIASWLSLKRHKLLFKSLSKIKHHISKVAIIGYPLADRTIRDIIKESQKHNIENMIHFYENIKQQEVARLLQQSKVNIMLSKREGANKALYESFFSNVPVIVSSENIGINRESINYYTGIFATDQELPYKIAYMVNNFRLFSPRKWAMNNTGYPNSNIKLNHFIKQLATSKGEYWSNDLYLKKNFTNAIYVKDEDRRDADKEFEKLIKFLRV